MTKDEFASAAERMGLSSDNLATALGMHRATAFRYANGDSEIPPPVAMAIQLLEIQRRKGQRNFASFGTTPLRARRR